MKKIILATGNPGKVRELNAMLNGHYSVFSQKDLQVREVPETGSSFIENALIKARNASLQTKLPALADDSGLVVDALNGEPGIYSARYAKEGATDEENRQHLKKELEKLGLNQAKAYFVCVLVLVQVPTDPFPLIATGLLEGSVKTTIQGDNGFGYDPMFYPKDSNVSLGEMGGDKKALLSHRGKAIQILKRKIEGFASE